MFTVTSTTLALGPAGTVGSGVTGGVIVGVGVMVAVGDGVKVGVGVIVGVGVMVSVGRSVGSTVEVGVGVAATTSRPMLVHPRLAIRRRKTAASKPRRDAVAVLPFFVQAHSVRSDVTR